MLRLKYYYLFNLHIKGGESLDKESINNTINLTY